MGFDWWTPPSEIDIDHCPLNVQLAPAMHIQCLPFFFWIRFCRCCLSHIFLILRSGVWSPLSRHVNLTFAQPLLGTSSVLGPAWGLCLLLFNNLIYILQQWWGWKARLCYLSISFSSSMLQQREKSETAVKRQEIVSSHLKSSLWHIVTS